MLVLSSLFLFLFERKFCLAAVVSDIGLLTDFLEASLSYATLFL